MHTASPTPDKVDLAFQYVDARLQKVQDCIDSYIVKVGRVSNVTALTILRTFEADVIKKFYLLDDRKTRNQLRDYIMSKLGV